VVRTPLIRLLVGLIVALGSPWATAQAAPSEGRQIVHESWTFKDGAPEVVTALAQTSDGSLWLGSPSGLFRFDGVRFELFRSPFGDPLYSTNVSALLAVGEGLWVGYVFGGFSFVKHGKVSNFAEPTASISGFAHDKRGITWAAAAAGGTRSGLWRHDGTAWKLIGMDWGIPNGAMGQVGFDREGTLWALMGARGPEIPKQLYSLAQGDKQFRKVATDLHVHGFTRDADGIVLTSSAPPGQFVPPVFEGSISVPSGAEKMAKSAIIALNKP